MSFEWDEDKAAANMEKHGVSFEEAQTVFDDFYDLEHSHEEPRYIILGASNRGRLLMVSYTERGDNVRLISSREATPAERRAYEED
jgi:uncharacterized DUF497 family protein